LDELTPQELLVMQTIAAGATYREAAQSLFLSPKTIEFHLGKVYRKLGVRSRRELLKTLERLEAEGADVTAGG
jgi:DNA-binding CsgD family transcriptional regulator